VDESEIESQSEKQATGDRRQAIQMKKGADIAARLVRLGVEVLRLARRLSRDLISRHVVMQLVRAATSAGANYEEARAAESRADFAHKLGIAAKEARETIYWLRLIHLSSMTTEDIAALAEEARALAAILVASRRTALSGAASAGP
jgi:four helix bundle protein